MITEDEDKARKTWRREMEKLTKQAQLVRSGAVEQLDVAPHLAGRV